MFELRYLACRNRKAAMRQAFSNHQSFGGWELPGDVMCSLISGSRGTELEQL